MSLPTPVRVQGFALFVLTALIALVALTAPGQPASNSVLFAARAGAAFARAQQAFAARPGEATNAWQLGRASYDWAEFATNTDERAAVAQTGIAACKQLLARDPQSAPAHYYLAMDLGQLAEAEAPSLTAYKLVREIEREFKAADDLDERLDFAGPPRCLGLLYRDAPGWPFSIGNKHKAREYLDHAAALAPDFPENQLNLVESHVRWRQAADAETAWQKLAAIWPAAHTNLTGVAWESDWDDWNTRRGAVQADFQKAFKRALEP
jgi:tetratricopeptide (TPR) repeat protein